MLQRFLIIALTLCSLSATAQWQQTGSKVRYVNGLGIPTKDTAAGVAADSSQILIRPADSALYIKYKRTWLRVGGGGGSIAGSGTTNYIPKFTSASAIGNSQIFDNGTGVGIGTASPSTDLQISRAGSSTLRLTNTSNATNVELGIATALGFIGTNTDNSFAINTNNTERVRITNTGNVGIGTASPNSRLDVDKGSQSAGGTTPSGAILVANRAAGNGILELGTNASAVSWLQSRNSTSATYYDLALQPSGGNVGIGYTAPVAKLAVSGTTLINTNTDNGVDKLQVSGSMNVSTLATTNNLSVTTNATVGGTLRVTGSTTLGTTTTGAITASSIDAASGNATFGNIYSNGIVQMLGMNVKYRNISATYTATTSDDYFINITSGTFTLNLPTAATPFGQVYVIKNSGTGTVTVDPNGTQTIDGATTFAINVQNQSITIIGDGSNWKIVSKYL